jgi:hypothetical protein
MNKFIKRIVMATAIVATVAAVFVCFGERFFAPQTGNDDAGEQIPILGWHGIPVSRSEAAHYQVMKEAGFTHNLPGDYVTDPSRVLAGLDHAQTAGIKVFIVGDALTQNDADTAFVSRVTSHPALAGYKVWDEPAISDYERLSSQVHRIQAIDSLHPCYINLLHSGAAFNGYTGNLAADQAWYNAPEAMDIFRRDYLEQYAGLTQFLSFDAYPVTLQDGRHTVAQWDSLWYRTLEIFRDESQKLNKPFWAFACAINHKVGESEFPVPTLADLRLQVYSNLAYGAQGIQYFTYWQPGSAHEDSMFGASQSIVDKDGHKTPTYDVVKQMNREITGLSKVFLHARPVWVAHTGRLPNRDFCKPLDKSKLPDAVQTLDITGSDGAVVSLLEKGDDRFLVMVNRDLHRDMTVTIKGKRLKRIEKDGSVVATAGETHTVTPGDVLIYSWNNG